MEDPGDPPFPVEAEALAVLGTLWAAGHSGYLVGGGVRDALLGLPVADWDIATDARPERILDLFPGSTYENRFGTVLARGHEITTFRRDHRYADHRRPDSVTFSQDVYEDLARRDLTINAIAWGRRGPDTASRLLDPADGQGDLRARLVRAVGDPGRRFDEDALRLLRAVRIAARLGFDIEPVTYEAMRAHAEDTAWVSEERVGSEIRRMLATAPARAIELLADTGVLAIALPEVEALPRVALTRTKASLEAVAAVHPGNEHLALAALLAEVQPGLALAALQRLRLGGRDTEVVVALVEGASQTYERSWSDARLRRYMASVQPERLDDVLALRLTRAQADEAMTIEAAGGGVPDEVELASRVDGQRQAQVPLALADMAVDGDDLRRDLGLPEGPQVGTILERLLDKVIEDPTLNQHDALLERARHLLDEDARALDPRPGAPSETPPNQVGSGS
jgi:tRNA nucleotidyltransferase/poly(A) polymerase